MTNLAHDTILFLELILCLFNPSTRPRNLDLFHAQKSRPMYVWSSHRAEYISTGKGCQSCSWSAEQGKIIFPCTRSRLRILSRETGSAVPSRISLLILHSQSESVALLTEFLPISAAASIFFYRHTPSGHSRVYRVTRLRIDGIHCRESAGIGPVVLKVVPVTGAALAGHHGPINVRLSFPIPTIINRTC